MKYFLDACVVFGALGSFGSFVLLVLTFWRSYNTDKPLDVVWEHRPHGDLPNGKLE
jgi:hypothetical protein